MNTQFTSAPESFTRSKFQHRQTRREGMVAIYERGKEGQSKHWEVVILTRIPDTEFPAKDGKPAYVTPAHEKYPGDEEWGTRGWTLNSPNAAHAKFEELMWEVAELPKRIREAHVEYAAFCNTTVVTEEQQKELKRLAHVYEALCGRYVTLTGEEIQ